MNAERWKQVEALFESALEREPVERAAYLDKACGDDAALRQEVESLLAHQQRRTDSSAREQRAAEYF